MKRWPIIRHVRYFYLSWRVSQHYRFWRESFGSHDANREWDNKVLDAIWKGEC